jgi:hypothetical protein
MPTFDDAFADDVSLATTDDDIWMAFSISRLDGETVIVRNLATGEDCEPFEGHSFRPSVTTSGDHAIVSAAELTDRLRAAVARVGPDGAGERIWRSDGDGEVFDVVTATTDDATIWVAWDELEAEEARVYAGPMIGGAVETIDLPANTRTPAMDATGDTVWLACVEGLDDRRIAVFRSEAGNWIRVATLDDGTAEAPSISAISETRAVVAWHGEVGAGLRWLRAAEIDGHESSLIELPQPPVFDRTTSPTDQGWEFPRVLATEDEVVLAGRSAQNFHIAFGDTNRLGKRAAQCVPGWGGCGRMCDIVRAGGELHFGRRDRTGVVVEPALREAEPLPPERPDYGDETVGPPAEPETSFEGVQFGQFHQHTAHSDGTGSVWDVLLRAKRADLDFTALTDHDRFCGKAIGPATWRYMLAITDFLQTDDFAVIPAVEFTGARHPGPGHKNVYFEGEPPAELPEHTIENLRAMVAEHPAIVIPHHVGFTGWDIEHHDPDFQPLWEICSVHGVYEEDEPDTIFIPRDDALLEGHTLRAALDAGHRFGFCAGADDHGLLWHHGASPRRDPAHTGLTAVLAQSHDRAEILAGLRNRRCYATSGARILLDVSLDDAPMGSDVDARESGELRIRAHGTADITRVDIVCKDYAERINPENGTTFDLVRELTFDGPDYVYVRITQKDHDMAWSSPIFVG